MQVIFTERFRYSPNGYDVLTYEAGDAEVEVSDECAEIAISIGRAHVAGEKPAKPHRGGKKASR